MLRLIAWLAAKHYWWRVHRHQRWLRRSQVILPKPEPQAGRKYPELF